MEVYPNFYRFDHIRKIVIGLNSKFINENLGKYQKKVVTGPT